MYLITNRRLEPKKTGIAQLGDKPNPEGPNELRLVEATRRGKKWTIKILPDKLTPKMIDELTLSDDEKKAVQQGKPLYASRYVAEKVWRTVNPNGNGKNGRNLLFFVHGYNNDVEAVLDRAEKLTRNFGVEVVPFSWPANGGGIEGVIDYKSDKRDAVASTGALERSLAKMYDLLNLFNRRAVDDITEKARRKFERNPELRDEVITRMTMQRCPFTVNMMLHSMGNYLFKRLLTSSIYRATTLLFDNVLLVAADTNNKGHAEWVDRIQCRRRVYITINEDDAALRASRIKSGEEQLARLGHYPHNLYSTQALYIDFTDRPHVGSSHAYFEGGPIQNGRVKRFFDKALNGERAEADLTYDSATRMYRFE